MRVRNRRRRDRPVGSASYPDGKDGNTVKNQTAKNQTAKNRTAKSRTTKNRTTKEETL
jgi:hypothetical protein